MKELNQNKIQTAKQSHWTDAVWKFYFFSEINQKHIQHMCSTESLFLKFNEISVKGVKLVTFNSQYISLITGWMLMKN